MYDWLSDALLGPSQVVTANRRLARVLTLEYGQQQIALGHAAWRSPAVHSWQDWLTALLASAELTQSLPTRINGHQSRVLWERCLRREISDPLLNIAMLVRQAREAWARLHEFAVPLEECEAIAYGRDQNTFARAARSYQSLLERDNWVDEATAAGLATDLVRGGHTSSAERVIIAGFDQLSPQATRLLDALQASGVSVEFAPVRDASSSASIHRYENPDAELRAAGAWARQELEAATQQSIAIVAMHLDRNAARCARLIREGLAPGWQTVGAGYEAAVNVSYGSKLSAYPAIAIALLALRWLQHDLQGHDVSTLLRAMSIGNAASGGRSRLELLLRQMPDRSWSPAMLTGALANADDAPDARDWLTRVAAMDTLRSELPPRATPPEWAVLFDGALKKLNWPGDGSLGSFEFQLVNRWRELLNDLARLQLVSPKMTLSEALARLNTMANETVFQPESDGSIVQLLGPLEAAGMQFDQLWVAGLSAANWPPAGRPSPLISRRLQRDYGMPDADPDNTLDYARRVLQRLAASASRVKCSFPHTDGDAEQVETGLLMDIAAHNEAGHEDPGWHAAQLVNAARLAIVAEDRIPPVSPGELISGGAATINRQLQEPFSAFAYGRLGIRSLPGITTGLAASLRGSLIHDALHNMYSESPAQSDIAGWDTAELGARVTSAVHKAFYRHRRFAGPVLRALLQLEQQRVVKLLRQIVALDLRREPFTIAEVEVSLQTEISGVRLGLRIDRIDRLAEGGVVILDYKTGAPKKFLGSDGLPKDMQLVVYAYAVNDDLAGLGLINIDSRSITIDGAGVEFTPDLDWQVALHDWKAEVRDAASDIQHGDVRINGLQNRQTARPLSVLSRMPELRRDN